MDVVGEVKRCVDNFKCRYPNYREDVTTMLPADFRFGYIAAISKEASGYNELKQIEEATLKGDEAEKLVFDALSKSCLSMFVIRGLKFTRFLQSVLGHLEESDFKGEIDFVIIHWKIGILLLEVKSKYSKKNEQTALKQLDGREKTIKKLLNVLPQIMKGQSQDSASNQANSLVASQTQVQGGLQVYQVYVAPNDVLTLTQGGNAPFRLDKEALGNIVEWFAKFPKAEFKDWEREVLHKLCCVLVCQRTEVTTTSISEVYACIDEQKSPRQSYDKQNKKGKKKKEKKEEEEKAMGESPKAVVSTQDHPGLSSLKGKFKFLNQQQLAVWEGPLRQLIHGVTGSGKTLLLQYKALECASKGVQVKVIVSHGLLSRYKKFFEHSKNVTIVDWSARDLIEVFRSDGLNCHIFVDESQLILSRLEFVRFPSNEKKYYCWFALDEMQADADDKEKESLGKGKYEGSEYVKTLHTAISTMIEKKDFHKAVLDTCMRYTTNIHSFIQEYMKYSEITLDDRYPTMKIGHNVTGEKVTVFVFNTAVNSFPDPKRHFPSAYIKPVEDCESEQKRHDRCMEIVKETINNDNNNNPSVIFVVADSRSFKTDVCNPLQLGIHIQELFFEETITALSCEWRTVFVICKSEEFLKNYIAMTRAVCKLVVMFV